MSSCRVLTNLHSLCGVLLLLHQSRLFNDKKPCRHMPTRLSLLIKRGVQGLPRSLNHSRFPDFRKYRRSAHWQRAALVFAHACGSLCRLWRQQPAGLSLPSGAPSPYAAEFFASVASDRRTHETRLSPTSGLFNGPSHADMAKTLTRRYRTTF